MYDSKSSSNTFYTSQEMPINGYMLIIEKNHIRIVKVYGVSYDVNTHTWTGLAIPSNEYMVCDARYFYTEEMYNIAFEDARNYIKMGLDLVSQGRI